MFEANCSLVELLKIPCILHEKESKLCVHVFYERLNVLCNPLQRVGFVVSGVNTIKLAKLKCLILQQWNYIPTSNLLMIFWCYQVLSWKRRFTLFTMRQWLKLPIIGVKSCYETGGPEGKISCNGRAMYKLRSAIQSFEKWTHPFYIITIDAWTSDWRVIKVAPHYHLIHQICSSRTGLTALKCVSCFGSHVVQAHFLWQGSKEMKEDEWMERKRRYASQIDSVSRCRMQFKLTRIRSSRDCKEKGSLSVCTKMQQWNWDWDNSTPGIPRWSIVYEFVERFPRLMNPSPETKDERSPWDMPEWCHNCIPLFKLLHCVAT